MPDESQAVFGGQMTPVHGPITGTQIPLVSQAVPGGQMTPTHALGLVLGASMLRGTIIFSAVAGEPAEGAALPKRMTRTPML